MKNTLEGINSTLGVTEPQKAPVSQSNLEKKRTKLRISHSLTFNYITKLLSSKQHNVGTKHRCGVGEDS